jgi:hypothetical protein
MAENETIEGFKRNMSLLVQSLANGTRYNFDIYTKYWFN